MLPKEIVHKIVMHRILNVYEIQPKRKLFELIAFDKQVIHQVYATVYGPSPHSWLEKYHRLVRSFTLLLDICWYPFHEEAQYEEYKRETRWSEDPPEYESRLVLYGTPKQPWNISFWKLENYEAYDFGSCHEMDAVQYNKIVQDLMFEHQQGVIGFALLVTDYEVKVIVGCTELYKLISFYVRYRRLF